MFEPIYPAHAVESCIITLFFDQPVPAKPFARARQVATEYFSTRRFIRQDLPGFSMEANTNRIVPVPTTQLPIQFTSIDSAEIVTLSPDSITIRTGSYVRWKPFWQMCAGYVAHAFPDVHDVVAISGIRAEYVDRFFWTNGWDTIDFTQLIRPDSPLVTRDLLSKDRQWHSHVGWFERNEAPSRRLINVDVDTVDAQRPSYPTLLPSVSIHTLVHDQPNLLVHPAYPVWELGASLDKGVDEIHRELKKLLGALITDETQSRIRLFEELK